MREEDCAAEEKRPPARLGNREGFFLVEVLKASLISMDPNARV